MTNALVLDAGALIALDRDDRAVWAMLRVAVDEQTTVVVPAGAVAQAWRDGARQALLSRALSHCVERPLDSPTARAAGLLCGRSGTADVIDASVALTAAGVVPDGEGAAVLTSDPTDIVHLLDTLSCRARVVRV